MSCLIICHKRWHFHSILLEAVQIQQSFLSCAFLGHNHKLLSTSARVSILDQTCVNSFKLKLMYSHCHGHAFSVIPPLRSRTCGSLIPILQLWPAAPHGISLTHTQFHSDPVPVCSCCSIIHSPLNNVSHSATARYYCQFNMIK